MLVFAVMFSISRVPVACPDLARSNRVSATIYPVNGNCSEKKPASVLLQSADRMNALGWRRQYAPKPNLTGKEPAIRPLTPAAT